MVELMIVVGLIMLIVAIALPMMSPAVAGYQLGGDAQGISHQIAVAKMRAASYFTRARVYVDLSSRSYRVEIWQKSPAAWVPEGGATSLSGRVNFSFGPIATPPPNSQPVIGFSLPCRDAANAVIANTSCIVFNSRGIPIDSTGTPIGDNAIYVSDPTAVYGATVSATGLIRLWWTPTGTLAWQRQ
jgi:hypothetical protein